MESSHYVYIYKDKKNTIKYIGYGKEARRAISHERKTHNASLSELINDENYNIHIAGPFDSEITARSVEAALISALTPNFNKKQERSEWCFRPIAVKKEYADRLIMKSIKKSDLLINHRQILFVKISNANFEDRVGYDIASPPSDEAIVARVEKSWQLNKLLPKWCKNPKNSPSLVIGVIGSPGSQIIAAALEIDTNKWDEIEIGKHSLITLPLKDKTMLDVDNLRGRKIDRVVKLSFGRNRNDFFRILKRNFSLT